MKSPENAAIVVLIATWSTVSVSFSIIFYRTKFLNYQYYDSNVCFVADNDKKLDNPFCVCRTLALHQGGYALLLCYSVADRYKIEDSLESSVYLYNSNQCQKAVVILPVIYQDSYFLQSQLILGNIQISNITRTRKGSILYNVFLYYTEYERRFYVVLISCYA